MSQVGGHLAFADMTDKSTFLPDFWINTFFRVYTRFLLETHHPELIKEHGSKEQSSLSHRVQHHHLQESRAEEQTSLLLNQEDDSIIKVTREQQQHPPPPHHHQHLMVEVTSGEVREGKRCLS